MKISVVVQHDKLVEILKSLEPHRTRFWSHEYEAILKTRCIVDIVMIDFVLNQEFLESPKYKIIFKCEEDKLKFSLVYL